MKTKIFITIKGGYIQALVSNSDIEVTILDKDIQNGPGIENYIPDSIMTKERFKKYKEREIKDHSK
ncbi:MAG TPA: hypothetical protein VIQ23_10055 [Hanamia sp.]